MVTFEIKKILTPTDFSEIGLLAVEHAAFMARMCKANLVLLHAIKASEYSHLEHNVELAHKSTEAMDNYLRSKLEDLSNSLKNKYAINVTTSCLKGNPAAEIMKVVKEQEIDIVIMGTHGASGFNEFFIGSNAHKTIRKCECPVLTLQKDSHKLGFSNIVLPIENSYHSLEKVNRTVRLAKIYSAKIHLLGLLDTNEEIEVNKFTIKLEQIEKVISHGEVAYDRTIVHGKNLAQEALRFSEKINADLIVVLTDHESELNEVPISALAKNIVNHSTIPVLSIKPKPGIFSGNSPT